MRLQILVWFAFLVSVVLADVNTTDFPARTKLQVESDINISVSRSLSTKNVADNGFTEERTGKLSVSALEKFKTMITSSKATPEKLASWLKSGKSTDAVFARLHLDKPGSLFLKPQFTAWIQYADALSTKFPEMSAMSTLTRRYGDEVLFRLIKIAKRNPATENLATQLETKQIQYWVATRKDPDEVFRLFDLDARWANFFEKPEFATWTKFVDDLDIKHPEQPTSMYATLAKYFKDETILKKSCRHQSGEGLASGRNTEPQTAIPSSARPWTGKESG